MLQQRIDGHAGIDDFVDQDDVPVGQIGARHVMQLDAAGRLAVRDVAGHDEKIDEHVTSQVAHQVGGKDRGPLQRDQQDDLMPLAVLFDERCEFAHSGVDLHRGPNQLQRRIGHRVLLSGQHGRSGFRWYVPHQRIDRAGSDIHRVADQDAGDHDRGPDDALKARQADHIAPVHQHAAPVRRHALIALQASISTTEALRHSAAIGRNQTEARRSPHLAGLVSLLGNQFSRLEEGTPCFGLVAANGCAVVNLP